MLLQATQSGAVTVAAPTGRIDHEHAATFTALIEPHVRACKAGAAPLLIDLSGVDYVSSVGLRALMIVSRRVKVQGGAVDLAALQPNVREIFEISRFDLVFKIHATVAAGVAALSA